MPKKILVVDDDPIICEMVGHVLKKDGFIVHSADSAEAGLIMLRQDAYDLMILDVGLPGISGIKTCEIIKQDPATAHLPVIMLTAEGAEAMKVRGLNMGADDYVTKPPSPAEFTARVHAVLRRVQNAGVPNKIYEASRLKVDVDGHQVFIDGKAVKLRPKEFQLLCLLMEKEGKVLSHSAIQRAIWDDSVVTGHTLEVHINNLREKLGALSFYIQTIPGVGYKFSEED
jgi:DNA-binding response OmpR family regulator